MAKILALAILWLLQAALIVLFINAQWTEEQARIEQARMLRSVGEQRYAQLLSRSTDVYRRWFVAPGIVQQSYRRLLPDHTRPQQGMEGLAPWFWVWFAHRLDAFWWMVYRAIFRLELCRIWAIPIVFFAATASIDGLTRRAIMRANHVGPSSDRYRAAAIALVLLLFLAVLYLTAPMCVEPFLVPWWGVSLGIACRTWLANTQHRV